jgi:NarL family two-component system response regulator LiaR
VRDYSKVVLIVDDNRLIRNALRSFLELKAKMEVCGEATDGIEALEKARKLRPNLILMDLSMPNLNGLDAAIAIKRAVPEARIVVFTLFADTVGGVIAKTLGVDLVVSKTEGADGLLRALQPLLAKDDSSLLH